MDLEGKILIGLGVALAALVALIVWAAASGELECGQNEHSEIVSYMTTTNMVGKTPVTSTTPIYACVKN